ncbi:hypothetical protein TYRP_020776 [Tyrophagus putrescentiae]|nr:hypothetical protein TYRP_020776 [Tyrophagus putrescentiae]
MPATLNSHVMVNNFNEQSAKFNGAGNQNVNKPKVGGSSMSVKPQVTKAKSNKLPKEVLAKILAKKKIGAVAAAAEAKENSINFPMLPMMSITQSTRLDKSIFIPSNIRVIGQANKEVIVCALVQSKNTKVSPANNSNVNSRSLLLAFDQHAVHERIRLETLRKATFHELTVEDASLVTALHRLHQLTEQVSRQTFIKFSRAAVVELQQVLGIVRSLHDNHKLRTSAYAEPVEQADDALNVGHLLQAGHLSRNEPPVGDHIPVWHFPAVDHLDGYL